MPNKASRRARIAMVLNTIGFGGVPQVAYQLMRHLPGDKYDLRLFVLKDTQQDSQSRNVLRAQFEALDVDVTVAHGAGGKFVAISELVGWLSAEQIDLVHTHSYRPNLYARTAGALCRAGGLRMIAHYHNQYDDKWAQRPDLVSVERQLARNTDAMIAVSHSVGTHIAGHLGLAAERLDVIHNGVDTSRVTRVGSSIAREKLGLAADRPTIGLIGRVCEQKGQVDLIEAAAALRRRHPDIAVLLIGDIEDKRLYRQLQARISALGLDETVRFTGHRSDMPVVYGALDILVAPSRWEGFGLMLVEAMAAGTPIVASNVGAIPEIVGESALLVAPRDPEALAAAVGGLLRDDARREQMRAAGHERCKRYSWPSAARQLEEIYDRVLATRPEVGACG